MPRRRTRPYGPLLLCALLWTASAGVATRTPVVAPPTAVEPAALAAWWDAERLDLPAPPLVTHDLLVAHLDRLRERAPDVFSFEQIGESVEGRSLHHVAFGRGPFRVLMWSQMHGDEPTATSALLDVFEYVHRRREDPVVVRLLDRLTVHVVPMLNPDGAERFERRNAQGIDMNRDALLLQTPEGRALKQLRDRFDPRVGFNLHNQNWRTSVGRPPQPAAMSLLAVAFDEARSENEGRILAKKVCAVIRDTLEPMAPGRLGRYDDEFEVRAFGDNVTLWGTSVVLIETGPWPGPEPDRALVRLNFVGLLTALDALASGRVHDADPARYESLPINESRLFHTLITNARIATGTGVPAFTGDIGIVATRVVRREGGRREIGWAARIEDLGDLRVFGALESIDATGLTAAPLFDPGARVGDRLALPDWSGSRNEPRLAPGQPAAVLLLRPEEPGWFRVERIVRVE